MALDLWAQTRFCARTQLGTSPPQPAPGQSKERVQAEAPWDPPAPKRHLTPPVGRGPGPQPAAPVPLRLPPHPLTSPLGGQPPASVPPWQSRGVGEAEREREREA